MRKRLFSALQPSGRLHLGNYLGAIRQWVHLQKDYESVFCLVDLHAITVPQAPEALRRQAREAAALLWACGLDPAGAPLFIQSHIAAHAELAWMLGCLTPLGWLRRMTQFKQKAREQSEETGLGLLAYPALMAADILLYDTDVVPVGEDQRQHLELTRDLAQRFNGIYGETFKRPEAILPESGARIMGLDQPMVKMSKSAPGPRHAVYLLDEPDAVRGKIMAATTDSLAGIVFDPARAGLHNLLVIYERLTGRARPDIEAHFAGKGYAVLKRELADIVIEALRPIRERYLQLMNDAASIEELLRRGADAARPLAEATLARARAAMGLG